MGLGSAIYKHKLTGEKTIYSDFIDEYYAIRGNRDGLDEYFSENYEFTGDRESGGYRQTPQERQRSAVYATGNKWAIENWNETHN